MGGSQHFKSGPYSLWSGHWLGLLPVSHHRWLSYHMVPVITTVSQALSSEHGKIFTVECVCVCGGELCLLQWHFRVCASSFLEICSISAMTQPFMLSWCLSDVISLPTPGTLSPQYFKGLRQICILLWHIALFLSANVCYHCQLLCQLQIIAVSNPNGLQTFVLVSYFNLMLVTLWCFSFSGTENAKHQSFYLQWNGNGSQWVSCYVFYYVWRRNGFKACWNAPTKDLLPYSCFHFQQWINFPVKVIIHSLLAAFLVYSFSSLRLSQRRTFSLCKRIFRHLLHLLCLLTVPLPRYSSGSS